GITDPELIDPEQQPGLIPYDLTRRGRQFTFRGHTDVKQEAAYVQDSINLGGLTLQAGLRADLYRGLSRASGIQPRVGVSYLYKPTATVIRFSYSRFFETPYNENLILSSATGAGGLATNVFGAFGAAPLRPGRRNQYNAGLQQGIGKHIVVDGSYFWKYTRNAYDFDTLFNTPIAFPISWRESKIDGLSVRVNLAQVKGFSAFSVLGHTRARFFGPEIGGLIFNSPLNNNVFRIDHDQAFQQTTHLRYQYKKTGPWMAFTWRYDSGLASGRVPDVETALSLSGDQQAAIRFHCGNTYATVANPIAACSGNASAQLLRIPKAGTQNDDTNPSRIEPRHLFDLGAGIDNLFHTERPRFTLQFTAVNVTNHVALYNFLSTFSGTHFVTPRAYTAEIGMVW
ncbi:MAG: TonB-dependent receptor, partial [Acidobacteriota bacterium]|nr:TonB-dependent receptor [Acidobacteriota bacterium]